MRPKVSHCPPLHMRTPDDIRPGSINGILGVAMQMPHDATLTADEARELYDYVNNLEHVLNLVIRQAAQGVGVVVEGEEYPDPEKAKGPDALLPKPSTLSINLRPSEADVIRFGSMVCGGEGPGREHYQPYWELAKAKRRRAAWWKKQEKRHAKWDAEREARGETDYLLADGDGHA